MTRFFIINIYFTLSLHFTPGLQSAFYTDRPNNRFFDGKFIPEDKTIHWTCNKGKYVRAKAKTSEYFDGKHNNVRSKEHVVNTQLRHRFDNNLTFSAILTLEIPFNPPGLVFEFTIIAALRIFSVLHNSTLGKRRLDGRQIVVDVVACLVQYPIDLPLLSFIRVYFVQRSTKTPLTLHDFRRHCRLS